MKVILSVTRSWIRKRNPYHVKFSTFIKVLPSIASVKLILNNALLFRLDEFSRLFKDGGRSGGIGTNDLLNSSVINLPPVQPSTQGGN